MIAFLMGSIESPGIIYGDRLPAPMGDRVCIGIQIGPVPQFRSVRGRGVTRVTKCGHPSRRAGQCFLPFGHTGCHAFGEEKKEEAPTPARPITKAKIASRCLHHLAPDYDRCILEHGHAGAHVYEGEKP